jgi:alpha-ribazole phosphatase
MLLHLMRHGEPELTGRMLGRTDCGATAAGIAACVAQTARLEIGALVSSDLRRTRVAAEAIAMVRERPLTIDPRWRELDFGDWDGLAAADLDSAALGRFWQDPDRDPPPGGERWSALVARVGAAIAALDPAPTLVVTHAGAMRAALAHLCGFAFDRLWAFDLPYGGLLSLRLAPEHGSAQIVGLRA